MKLSIKKLTKKACVSMMILVMVGLNIQIPTAQAAIVDTHALIQAQTHQQERDKIVAFLDRAEVQQQLQNHGVMMQDAVARVASMSDAEVTLLSGNIDQLPAGADPFGTLIGAAVYIFIILLITDILGFTNVYSFVHPIR